MIVLRSAESFGPKGRHGHWERQASSVEKKVGKGDSVETFPGDVLLRSDGGGMSYRISVANQLLEQVYNKLM